MSGSLGEWSIEDLLQIARITRKTTCIEVLGNNISGAIFLREGAVTDALVDGAVPNEASRFSQVVEAIETLAGIEDGTFEFTNRSTDEPDRPIEIPAITAAMEKDLIREKRLADLGIDGMDGLGIKRHIDEAISVKPAVWQLIANVIDPFSLDTLGSRMGRRKAVATLLTLDALGVLERKGPLESRDVGAEAVGHEEEPTPSSDAELEEDELVPPTVSLPMPHGAQTEPASGEVDRVQPPSTPLPDSENPWIQNQPATVGESEHPPHANGEPVVEIFEMPGRDTGSPAEMHEVVTPSETTLVSDVLGDMRSRFRDREFDEFEPHDL